MSPPRFDQKALIQCCTLLFEMLGSYSAPVIPSSLLIKISYANVLITVSKNSVRIRKFCLFMYNTIPQLDVGPCFHPSMWSVIETLHFHLCSRMDSKQSLMAMPIMMALSLTVVTARCYWLDSVFSETHMLRLFLSMSYFVYFLL